MKKALRIAGLALLVVMCLAGGRAAVDFLVATGEELHFRHQIANDPRYLVARQIEAENPGIYVVDVFEDTLRDERTIVYVMVTFDRRITKEIDSTPDDTGVSDLDRYIAHSRVSMIRAADQHMDYDVLALGLVHVRRQPVLGGEAWTAMVIFLEYADRESMMAWAENGATDYELRRGTIGHYGASPFEAPKYHHECLRRPSNEGLPPWEALEAEAK